MSFCNDDPNTFCNIGERDVDFLLLEELRCSNSFRRWFLRDAFQALNITGVPDAGNVFHSVSRTGLSSGETDLLVEFQADSQLGSGLYAVLIEDKIDAPFSDRTKCGSPQTMRYRAEIEKKVGAGEWVSGVTMLVAPKGYVQGVDSSAFDASISYEDISAWFAMRATKSEPTLALRFEHRRQMMQAALTRWRRGWNRQADEKVSGLWGQYYKIASSEFPDVCMKYKGGEPPDSYTVSFSCLPPVEGLRKCRIDHVMERGTVDILIPDGAAAISNLSTHVTPALAPEMSLRKAGKSLGINIKVSPIRRFEPLEAQMPSIREALTAVRSLKNWFEKHRTLLTIR